AEDLRAEWVQGRARVGLTAGASAPDVLVRAVIDRLRTLGATTVRSLPGVEEHVRFPLPMGLGDKSMAEVSSSRS
ncbi:MAG: 4-hydroxy-3-methylbut-2-enyl diphosphate reductase, partial [Roseateles sp.]